MGFFDSIKNALGGKDKVTEAVKGPSAVLKEAGIDPSGLDFRFGSDGAVTVTGEVRDSATREQIEKVIAGIPQVTKVENQLEIAAPEVAEPEPAPEPAPEPVSESEPEPTPTPAPAEAATPDAAEPQAAEAAETPMETYTVKPGDSLWKIAEARYGNGNKYHAIFDANRDILDNPDLIKPGQVLKLPEA